MPGSSATMENGSGSLANGVANGTDADESPFEREEYLRLLLQSLDELGYGSVRRVLETESGVLLQSPQIEAFQHGVLQGDWKLVEERIADLKIASEDDLKSARFLIYRQKFLELLEQQKTKEALECLRHELTPSSREPARLHKLSSMIMCTSPEDLRQKAGWGDGDPAKARAKARARVLTNLRAYVAPSVLLPERRLQALLSQSLQWQQQHCPYHNALGTKYSLFSDHVCTRSEIPSELRFVLEKHTDEVWHIAFSHNGLYLASGSKDNTIIIWDVLDARMRPLRTLTGHAGAVSLVAWSPDDSLLLTCSADNNFKLWDVATGHCRWTIGKHTESPTAAAWMPDGRRFVTGGIDKQIFLMDVEGAELQKWTGPRVNDIAISSDGRLMVVICQDKRIRIYDLVAHSDDFIQEQEAVTSLELASDDRSLLVNTSGHEMHLWDLSTKRLVMKFRGHRQHRFVIRSCFGGTNDVFVASGSEDSNVYIWHRRQGTLLETLSGHSGTVNAVSWNPKNPHMFASCSDDRTIRIWVSKQALNGRDSKPQ